MDYSDRFNGIIKLGDHLVLLYDSESSITDTVVAYISNSLLNNQKFIYITGDTDVKMIQKKLKELELFNSYVDSRQLVFLNQNEAYSKEGRFNPERMKELLKTLTIEAQTDGYEGLAISGEISWVLDYDKGFDLINEYEWKINSEVFGVFPVTALCRYNMDRFSDEMIINVIQLHPFLILNNKVYENPFYIPAIAYETNNIPKYQVKTWLENIVKFSSEKSKFNQRLEEKDLKVREFKNLLEISLDSAENVIMISLDKEYKYMYFNKTHYNDMKNAYNTKVKLGECIFDYMTSEEDIKRIKANYDIALSGKHHTSLEVYGDIETNYYETKFNPLYDLEGNVTGLTVFSSNVTERETAYQKQKESEEKYKLLNDNLPFGLCHLQVIPNVKEKKNEYYYLGVNKMFEKQVGMQNADFIGKTILDVFPDTEQYWMDYYDSVVATGDSVTFEEYSIELDRYMKISAYMIEFNQMAVIVEDVSQSRRKQKEINYLSYHDQLTGLYNRRFFEEQIKRVDNPRNLPLSIIMGDVNGLKLVNDAFGHQIGDQLLRLIGDIISDSIRGNDCAARWGGDEFTILMPTSDTNAAEVLINRIHQRISESSFDYGSLSISFGIETKRNKDEDLYELFKSAEALMYQNKLAEIDSIRGETINTIMNTLFEKSAEVKEHSTRVSELAASIAKSMRLSKASVNDIRTIGMIHDIGKIAIDLQILDKAGKLTDNEREIIQQHPLSGSRMLSSSHEYSRLAVGVLHHHERIDGKGYPNGISGDQIPIESKIIAVADAFDAMTAQRPYRLNPLSTEEAIAELQKHSGTQFDSKIVKVFVENRIEIIKK